MKLRILFVAASAFFLLFLWRATPAAIPPYGAWQEPVNLGAAVNSSSSEFFPTISKDGLSLYFTGQSCPSTAACRPGFGGWDIYVAQREALDRPWRAPENVGPAVNSEFDDVAPDLSRDGHSLFFASNRPGGLGGNDVYVARRHDKHDDFGWLSADNLGSGVNSAANDSGPAIFQHDATGIGILYFDSNRPDGPGPYTDDAAHNGNDIYASVLQQDGIFAPAALVTELSSPYVDRSPAIRRDGLEIFISSNRPEGRVGILDLWVATRPGVFAPWSAPVNLGAPINAAGQQAGATLSFDGTTMYLQSSPQSRPGSGLFDLFAATRNRVPGGESAEK